LKIGKNNFHKWRMLLKVLNKELPEDDPVFQHWLREDVENAKLYRVLKGDVKEGNIIFDRDKVFSNLSEILRFKTLKKVPLYKKTWFLYIAAFLVILSVGLFGYEQSKSEKKKTAYHTLDIPKGGEYKLLLPDGSKVYLNSETQLIFPDYFKEDVREVELIGEAYFEVKKNSTPFVVKTKDMQIRVSGTSFNVNAYQDVETVSATLVEGSIEVTIPTHSETFLIKPAYNFSVNKSSNEISVEKVNTDIYTSWIKGELVFRNQPLPDIFSKLVRWYDFTVVFEDPAIKTMRFTGSAMKEKPLDYLLNQIQSVTDIKYRNEGSEIILY
jgi:ferric-dicitrate binding protein FerR (iron transport regulator)